MKQNLQQEVETLKAMGKEDQLAYMQKDKAFAKAAAFAQLGRAQQLAVLQKRRPTLRKLRLLCCSHAPCRSLFAARGQFCG